MRGNAAAVSSVPGGVGMPGPGPASTPRQRPLSRRRTTPRQERRLLRVLPVLSVGGFLVLWQVAVWVRWIDPLYVSSPLGVVEAFFQVSANGTLWENLAASARLFGVGFGLAIVTGIPLGIAIGWYPRISALIDPFISFLYATPRIALIPLIFLWFGIGIGSQFVIVYLGAVFPVIINAAAGVKSVDPNLVSMARSFMSRDRDIFRTIALPSAVPFIVSGLRMSMTMALISVVVAEFFTGNVGLGAMITNASLTLNTNVAFVGVLVIAGLAIALTALFQAAEKYFGRWRA